ncbi:YrhB domain-containing protein [Microbacterium sp. IEGM 1404]|uniref:YrhB domain-containing protein n=1 Tax=Microbacterium sp. IEGM 1404 TaxID=3047084 RepID=UPI0024B82273|nr:YrhB domain-containing protein [Microbacterium sp. IEGM 1404]MDI9891372.1 YrhB domain-containing protein [Microbacterium sp. IEGM 1404]
MIDAAAARELVRQALRHAADRGGVRCVLVGETLDYGAWWVQGYQSEAFAVHGDVFQALAGNGPYVIPKNGDAVFTLSSAEPVDAQMARLAAAG